MLEIQDHPDYFEFTTEPIDGCLKALLAGGRLSRVESSYIIFQLCEVSAFLHAGGRLHLGLSPTAVFLSGIDVKVFGFNWSRPGPSAEAPAWVSWLLSPPLAYSAPELIAGGQVSANADAFSLGAVAFEVLEGKRAVNWSTSAEVSVERIEATGLDSSFEFVGRCLRFEAAARPTSKLLVEEPAFQTLEMKVLRYLDNMLVKTPKDKADFFRGLQKAIPKLSALILRAKVAPALLAEADRDARFAPLLIGPLCACGSVLQHDEFESLIFRRVAPLIKKTEIPQILYAFLQNIDTLFESIEHPATVYPVIFAALESTQALILKEVLAKLPALLPRMSGEIIQERIIPPLMSILTRQAADFTPEALACVGKALEFCSHEQFLKVGVPRIGEIFRLTKDPALIPPVTDMLLRLKGDDLLMLKFAIPLAAELCSHVSCDAFWQKQLSAWMLGFMSRWKASSKLDEVEDPKPKVVEPMSSEDAAVFDPLGDVK